MALKGFNAISVGGVVAFVLLLTMLYNVHLRDFFHVQQEVNGNGDPDPVVVAPKLGGMVLYPTETVTATVTKIVTRISPGFAASTEVRDSFLQVAMKWGTDKVTTHNYHHMYEKYLSPLRDQPLKMLEIGLGCNMGYGPGKSFYTWKEYLPNVDLYYIEYDKECVDHWGTNMHGVKVFSGSQEDEVFLDEFILASGGGFDIIIDDGGHTMNQQIVSLNKLFPVIKPGGLYFCEDLATSYSPAYGAVEGAKTMMTVVEELLHDLNWKLEGAPAVRHKVGKNMRSVECGEEICVFTKKGLEVTELVSGT